MAKVAGLDFERQVADAIKQLDYKVTREPWGRPDQTSWLDRISSWFSKPSGSPFVPDMMVAHGGKLAVVEAKAYPVLLGPVIQARHYAHYFEAPAIICVPDDAFAKIPASVCEFAQLNEIVLTPIGKIGDTLHTVLH